VEALGDTHIVNYTVTDACSIALTLSQRLDWYVQSTFFKLSSSTPGRNEPQNGSRGALASRDNHSRT
jgi:hypothetical protein